MKQNSSMTIEMFSSFLHIMKQKLGNSIHHLIVTQTHTAENLRLNLRRSKTHSHISMLYFLFTSINLNVSSTLTEIGIWLILN